MKLAIKHSTLCCLVIDSNWALVVSVTVWFQSLWTWMIQLLYTMGWH